MAVPRTSHPDIVQLDPRLGFNNPSSTPRRGMFDGLLTAQQLQDGFGIHTLNATARTRFRFDGHRNPGAVLHCFLEGGTRANLDGDPMRLGRRVGEPVKLVLTSVQEVLRFQRYSEPDEYVRKVSIQMSPEWLCANELQLPAMSSGKVTQRIEWVASHDEVHVLEDLAATQSFNTPVARIRAQSMALGLVARCFGDLTKAPQSNSLSPREQKQLRRFEEFARQSGALPSLREMAAEAGLSQSGLRRLIQSAHARSPLAHLRFLRLEMSRSAILKDQMSVEQAAAMAGYGSAANFTTAFRRAFGQTPRALRNRS